MGHSGLAPAVSEPSGGISEALEAGDRYSRMGPGPRAARRGRRASMLRPLRGIEDTSWAPWVTSGAAPSVNSRPPSI
jgi:hypothetical protein